MATEKKIVWITGKSMSGKYSKGLWKLIRAADTKKKLNEVIYALAYALLETEDKVYELRKFIGKKTKY